MYVKAYSIVIKHVQASSSILNLVQAYSIMFTQIKLNAAFSWQVRFHKSGGYICRYVCNQNGLQNRYIIIKTVFLRF